MESGCCCVPCVVLHVRRAAAATRMITMVIACVLRDLCTPAVHGHEGITHVLFSLHVLRGRQLVGLMKGHFGDDAMGRRKAWYFLPWHFSFFHRCVLYCFVVLPACVSPETVNGTQTCASTTGQSSGTGRRQHMYCHPCAMVLLRCCTAWFTPLPNVLPAVQNLHASAPSA